MALILKILMYFFFSVCCFNKLLIKELTELPPTVLNYSAEPAAKRGKARDWLKSKIKFTILFFLQKSMKKHLQQILTSLDHVAQKVHLMGLKSIMSAKFIPTVTKKCTLCTTQAHY